MLGAGEADVVNRACELLVPGSAAVRPDRYLASVLPALSRAEEDAVRSAIGVLAGVTDTFAMARLAGGAAFDRLRRVAIEAFYGDYAPPEHPGPTGHEVIGFAPPQAVRVRKDWRFLSEPSGTPGPWDRYSPAGPDRADVIVVGSGAGGGVIAADLAARGLDVLLLEAGGYEPAAAHTRFELEARRRLWWPPRTASTSDDQGIALMAGRCVGGSTVTDAKVAMRAPDCDIARFHARTGLRGERGPFALADLEPWYERIEQRLGVRERSDWTSSVYQVEKGFVSLGATLCPTRSHTDHNCTRCGSCPQGCPTNAGKSTLNTFLAPALAAGLRLRTRHVVQQVIVDKSGARPRVTGVAYRHNGRDGVLRAPVVVLAAGALNTPQILLRTQENTGIDTPSSRLVGRTLGLHPARIVYGRFTEPQDCHQSYPLTAHCLDHQQDFVVAATTIQDPVGFAESLVDEANRPMWGRRLVDTAAQYRHWAGLLVMATDENTAQIDLGVGDEVVVSKRFSFAEQHRLDDALAFGIAVLHAAGAHEVVWSGLSTTHMQGSAPMGDEPTRSVVDAHGRSHDVDGLYVGDGSLVPASLSVDPSLTIMALAARVAAHIAEEFAR
ncbi:GMC family oxidoreductase N-terminal domain-containing protein [Actinocrispum wychmicini]|uniref:Choline dehydrogenase-like flavoprotein n=1 Tax=Actinocrispum wychmicini TaxID=1213861 RepID=A0A4R2JDF2_9PSEU|nr:GMC family oxidoreductase [Actinocrispum wychmicini]TCO54818.1 choline dehydrogenase-like flavoprotein [Actinocrispum wychmicini]